MQGAFVPLDIIWYTRDMAYSTTVVHTADKGEGTIVQHNLRHLTSLLLTALTLSFPRPHNSAALAKPDMIVVRADCTTRKRLSSYTVCRKNGDPL